jgi:phasin family protein
VARTESPFPFVDVTKMLGDFKMPGLDGDKLMREQKKNLEALTAANKAAMDGYQAVMRRQGEHLKETMELVSKAVREGWSGASPEANRNKQGELAKAAFDRALSNMRELSEMAAKSNREAFDMISARMKESLEEFRKQAGA